MKIFVILMSMFCLASCSKQLFTIETQALGTSASYVKCSDIEGNTLTLRGNLFFNTLGNKSYVIDRDTNIIYTVNSTLCVVAK